MIGMQIDRRETFNLVPALYDEIRPKYPETILKAVEAYADLDASSQIAEVGPGTGQASAHFIEKGYKFLGIDLGLEIVAFANRKFSSFSNASFVQSSFEAWQASPRAYDLLIAAQSFHWIKPDIAIEKAARILKTGGSVALIWNLDESHETEFWQRGEDLHRKYLEQNLGNQGADLRQAFQKYREALEASPNFGTIETREHKWEKVYSTEEWIKMRQTFSPDLQLSSSVREQFHNEIRELITSLGGTFTRYYRCVCILARHKDH